MQTCRGLRLIFKSLAKQPRSESTRVLGSHVWYWSMHLARSSPTHLTATNILVRRKFFPISTECSAATETRLPNTRNSGRRARSIGFQCANGRTRCGEPIDRQRCRCNEQCGASPRSKNHLSGNSEFSRFIDQIFLRQYALTKWKL